MHMSPPYPPKNAGLGLTPTNHVDTPITSIFMILFLISAIIHMTILQINLRRGQKFLMSGMAFGFSFSRVIACIMRMVWASHPTNIRIAMAAQIFISAGTILLFLVNMIFTSRLLRAYHTWAWHPYIRTIFRLSYASVIMGLVTNLTVTIQSFYTLNPHILHIDHTVQLVVSTYFAIYAFMPIPLLALRLLLPLNISSRNRKRDRGWKNSARAAFG
ncbi:hypothetical protein NHQ30_003488 [Ciborinia camelliae]|nr:hypothetical protein NHQ30_003488 [Ciborinia camelliae]